MDQHSRYLFTTLKGRVHKLFDKSVNAGNGGHRFGEESEIGKFISLTSINATPSVHRLAQQRVYMLLNYPTIFC